MKRGGSFFKFYPMFTNGRWDTLQGENMKKKAIHTKVKVLSKDYIFHMANFY
jgi:hypothetical protein